MTEFDAWNGRRVTINDSGSPRQWKVVAQRRDGQVVLVNPYTGFLHGNTYYLHRLTRIPENDGQQAVRRMAGYSTVGGLPCTNDEATEWFAFLMLQASRVFEAVPDFNPETSGEGAKDPAREEVVRLLTARGETDEGPTVLAALAYYDAALEWYSRDKDRD